MFKYKVHLRSSDIICRAFNNISIEQNSLTVAIRPEIEIINIGITLNSAYIN